MEPFQDNEHIPYIKSAMDRIREPVHGLIPAAVKFRQWLMRTKMTVPQAALRCGFNPSTLYDYISGQPKSYPSLAQAFAIEWMTDGTVRAWEWLENPYIEARVRSGQVKGAVRFEGHVKEFVLKYNSLKTSEGMLRHRARILSRLFGVDWGEAKKRCWVDAKLKARVERANIDHLLTDPITEEEHNAQED